MPLPHVHPGRCIAACAPFVIRPWSDLHFRPPADDAETGARHRLDHAQSPSPHLRRRDGPRSTPRRGRCLPASRRSTTSSTPARPAPSPSRAPTPRPPGVADVRTRPPAARRRPRAHRQRHQVVHRGRRAPARRRGPPPPRRHRRPAAPGRRCPPADRVTLRQLLNHTSGLPDDVPTPLAEVFLGDPLPDLDARGDAGAGPRPSRCASRPARGGRTATPTTSSPA